MKTAKKHKKKKTMKNFHERNVFFLNRSRDVRMAAATKDMKSIRLVFFYRSLEEENIQNGLFKRHEVFTEFRKRYRSVVISRKREKQKKERHL